MDTLDLKKHRRLYLLLILFFAILLILVYRVFTIPVPGFDPEKLEELQKVLNH
jgi:preprotein translocase subunit SecY